MSAEAAAFVRTFRVGEREVTITLPRPGAGRVVHLTVEWSPSLPTKLSPAEFDQYRAGRDSALAELSAAMGISTMVIEA